MYTMRWGAVVVWGLTVGAVRDVRAGALRLALDAHLEELLVKNVTLIDGTGAQKQPGMRIDHLSPEKP